MQPEGAASSAVSEITGLARSTIERGLKDLDAPPLQPGQVRREGGGARPLTERDATLLLDLKRLVEPATLGDPVRPLLWVSKSLDKLTRALAGMGHAISPNSVRKLLTELGYLAAGQSQGRRRHPAIPIETRSSTISMPRFLRPRPPASRSSQLIQRKKNSLATIATPAATSRPKGDPKRVKVHDFEDKTLGKVAPYGVYDIAADADGSVSGSRMTQPSSRSRPFAHGSKRWGGRAIRQPVS